MSFSRTINDSSCMSIVMHVKAQNDMSRVCSFISNLQNNTVKIRGSEARELFRTRDVAAMAEMVNSNIGTIINVLG